MPDRYVLRLPELGMEGQPTVVSLWLVAEGSRVTAGQQVVEVLAGSALVDLPAPVDGLLVETLVAEDEPVEPGQPLGVFEVDQHADWETA